MKDHYPIFIGVVIIFFFGFVIAFFVLGFQACNAWDALWGVK